ncbi:MAG: Fic family protein, partial [Candidatus Duberdicusella sinuisediminis]
MKFGRQAKLGHRALLFMFSKPIVDVKTIKTELDVAFNTANSLLGKFLKAG